MAARALTRPRGALAGAGRGHLLVHERLGQVGTAESDIRIRPRLYRTPRTSAPNPASDHMRIATHSSSAAATKIAVISAPMILTIAVPSSILSYSSGYAMRMPEADRTQVRDSSSLDEVAETSESGDVPGQWETCPAYEGFSCRLKRISPPQSRICGHGAGARRSVRLDSLAAVLHRGVPCRPSQRNRSLCRLRSVSILVFGVR